MIKQYVTLTKFSASCAKQKTDKRERVNEEPLPNAHYEELNVCTQRSHSMGFWGINPMNKIRRWHSIFLTATQKYRPWTELGRGWGVQPPRAAEPTEQQNVLNKRRFVHLTNFKLQNKINATSINNCNAFSSQCNHCH